MRVADSPPSDADVRSRERPATAGGDPPIKAGFFSIDIATVSGCALADGAREQIGPDAVADVILRLRSVISEVRSEAVLARVLAQAAEKSARQEISDLRAQLAVMQAKITDVAPSSVAGLERPSSCDLAQRQSVLQGELDALRSSTSWRLTAPLRAVVSAMRGTSARSLAPSARR